MDLANSERESVIESAIDTISAIGWDSASGNSVWQHKQSEVFGAVGLISGRSDLNGGLNNEVAEDSRNLHSDASSIYPDNNKFGSLLSSEFSHHIPDMTQNLQRQDTFENTPTMDNREEFTEVTPTAISKVKQTYCNQQYPVTRTINAISSSRGSCGESLPSTSIRPSNEEENCKATLHGHEVTISEVQPPKMLNSDKERSTSTAAQAKKITFKSSYSCKIIRRERNAGIKLQRELQMRRKDQGSPKIVTLAQTKYHEKDPYLSKEKLENASLLEQMKRWLNIPKSRQRRNETNDETFDSRRETGSAYEISPHRNVKFNSPSPFSDYEAEAAPSSPSVCSLASGITPEQDRLPSAVSQGISDTVTYNCMNRSDVRRRIQNLKRLKRNKRKTVPAAIDGFEVNFIGGHGQPFDADIAAEQTYRKGIPNRRLNQNNNVMGKASSSHKFDAPKALKSKIRDEKKGFPTNIDRNELRPISHEMTTMMHKESIDALENISSHSRESMTKAQIRNITTKDVSCGPDSYVTAGRQGQSYEILREDLSTDSNSQKMRDKNVGTNEIASWTGNIPSLHENILEHSTNGNLYSQLWDNLQSDREIVETPKSTRLSKDDCNYRILYMDGYGNSKTLPHDVSIQLKSWLFPSSSKSSNQYSV